MSETVLYSTPATDAPMLVADRSGRPSSPSPRGRPHRLTVGRGDAVPPQLVLSLATFPTTEAL